MTLYVSSGLITEQQRILNSFLNCPYPGASLYGRKSPLGNSPHNHNLVLAEQLTGCPGSIRNPAPAPALPPPPGRLAAAGAVLPAAQQRLLSLLHPLVHPSSAASPHHHVRSFSADYPGCSAPSAPFKGAWPVAGSRPFSHSARPDRLTPSQFPLKENPLSGTVRTQIAFHVRLRTR